MQIPDPTNMELRNWADAVIYVTSQYTNMAPLDGEQWQDWGVTFFNNPQLGALHPPNPYAFTDWKEWAVALTQALANARGSAPRVAA
jgi:hypothetical protein